MSSVVQSRATNASGVANVSLAFSASNVSASNKLGALAYCGDSATLFSTSSVKDAALNSFTKLGAKSDSTVSRQELSAWTLTTPSGDVGTKPTLKATFSGTPGWCSLLIFEATGTTTDDTSAQLDGAFASASSGMSSGSHSITGTTTTATGELLFVGYVDGGWSETITVGTGFTQDVTDAPNANSESYLEHKASTNGAETGTISLSTNANDNYVMVMFALKNASGGGGGASDAVIPVRILQAVKRTSLF